MVAVSEVQLDALQDNIRTAGLDGSHWGEVMEQVHRIFPAASLQFLRHDVAHGIMTAPLTLGYDPWQIERFNAYFGTMNPWSGGLLNRPFGTILSCDEMCPYDQVVGTEFWADYIGPPQGDLTAGGGVVFSAGPDQIFGFGANLRKRDQEKLEPIFLRFVEHIRPAMAHALEVNRMMAGLRLETHVLRAGADPDGAAILILSRDQSLVWCNAEGARVLRDGLYMRRSPRGQVVMATGSGQAALGRGMAMGQSSVRLAATQGRTASLRIIRMGDEVGGILPLAHIPAGSAPLLVLIVHENSHGKSVDALLMDRHGLTQAEAAVALSLGEGARLAEIAEARGVSLHTVRNQLKVLRQKLGARTQGDVVRQVEALRHAVSPPRFP